MRLEDGPLLSGNDLSISFLGEPVLICVFVVVGRRSRWRAKLQLLYSILLVCWSICSVCHDSHGCVYF